jgi:hypothetical protein
MMLDSSAMKSNSAQRVTGVGGARAAAFRFTSDHGEFGGQAGILLSWRRTISVIQVGA